MLGRQVVAPLNRRSASVQAFTRDDLNIGDFAALESRLAEIRPTIILNCAAFTKVDDCESQPDRALRINGEAVGIMAGLARRLAALLVHVSSDYVFPGDAARPYRE